MQQARTRIAFAVLALAAAGGGAWLLDSSGYGEDASTATANDEPESLAGDEPVVVDADPEAERRRAAASVEAARAADPASSAALEDPLRREAGIEGRIVDARARPIAGAEVWLVRWEHREREPPRTRTGEDGRFEFPGIEAAADYVIDARAEPRLVARRMASRVVAGETLDVGLIALAEGSRFAGSVRADDGRFLDGVRLFVEGIDETRTTDAFGRFDFGVITSGRREISTTRAGYADGGAREIEFLPGADVLDYEIEIAATKPLRGRVVDGEGAAIAGADVAALSGGGKPGRERREYTTSRDDGTFEFTTLGPGSYTVEADSPGHQSWMVEGVEPGGEPVTIRLPRGCRVRGFALDSETSAPVTISSVEFWRRQDSVAAGQAKWWIAPKLEVRDGGAFVADVEVYAPESPMRLRVLAEDRAPGWSDWFTFGSVDAEVAVEVRFDRGATLAVDVVDADGRGIPGARVERFGAAARSDRPWSIWEAPVAEVATDGRGRATFHAVEAGAFRVVARRQDLASAMAEITIVAGEDATTRLVLGAGGIVLCRVRDLDDRPVPAARVTLLGESGCFHEAWTDEAGGCRIERVVPGGYRASTDVEADTESAVASLHLQNDGIDEYPLQIAHGASIAVDLRIDVREKGALEGVLRVDGEIVPAARVFAQPVGIEASVGFIRVQGALTGEDGRFRFERVGPGRLFLTALVGEDHEYAGPVCDVPPSGAATAVFDVTTAPLRGRVTDAATGQPLAEVTVIAECEPVDGGTSLRMTRWTRPSVRTDAEGRFAFEGLQRARHAMLGRAKGFAEGRVEVDVGAGASDAELRLTRGSE